MSSDSKHIYDYDVDLSSDTAAAHVVRMVGQDKKILEMGAGPGSITKHLKNSGRCVITAVEYDSTALPFLRPYCEDVYQLDLNQQDWDSALRKHAPFDVVVAADVLEHLYSPDAVLKRMATLINPSGYLVVSLPHVSHAGVMAAMLNENFQYGDWGLLDRTHIRFFGLHDIETLFSSAEMKIVAKEFVMRVPEKTEFADCWAQTPEQTRDFLRRFPAGSIYQVVVKAIPVSAPGEKISLMENMTEQFTAMTPAQSLYAWAKSRIPDSLRPMLRRIRDLATRR
jgi:2-polyprenyl-3-methyl-5-hydroxy-6-metoxy-1,4-benzoquinol methylase